MDGPLPIVHVDPGGHVIPHPPQFSRSPSFVQCSQIPSKLQSSNWREPRGSHDTHSLASLQ